MPSAAVMNYLEEIEQVDDSRLMVGFRLLRGSDRDHSATAKSARKAPAKKKAATKKTSAQHKRRLRYKS